MPAPVQCSSTTPPPTTESSDAASLSTTALPLLVAITIHILSHLN